MHIKTLTPCAVPVDTSAWELANESSAQLVLEGIERLGAS